MKNKYLKEDSVAVVSSVFTSIYNEKNLNDPNVQACRAGLTPADNLDLIARVKYVTTTITNNVISSIGSARRKRSSERVKRTGKRTQK